MREIEISEQEFHDNMEFCVDLCGRERFVWKIRRDTGEYVMCCPIVERAAPVDPSIMSLVEEFREDFMKQEMEPDAS